jgi:single-strand selective monofunctional uracil DNA glycosylase
MRNLTHITDELIETLAPLEFSPPVAHVYNPLQYARGAYDLYLQRYGDPPKEAILLGMNPGPWGMAQTGVPFGEVDLVKNWLAIQTPVGRPANPHPHKPVTGFQCPRSEVSGRRLWGWIRHTFGTPQKFFRRFFVANYCPLLFLDAAGRNITPDKLKAADRRPLLAVCDRAIRQTVECLRPRCVIGIGKFAAKRAEDALTNMPLTLGGITHPSPANPKANRGWEARIVKELRGLGIRLP